MIERLAGIGPVAAGLLIVAAIFGAGVGAFMLMDSIMNGGSGASKRRALCDVTVERLLNSPDLVEVTRAGIIIRRLNCRMWGRLP